MEDKKELIRIMHILPSLEIGGMEKALVQLVNRLDRTRYKNFICCIESNGQASALSGQILNDSVEFINFKKKTGIDISLALKLARAISENKIDIIHMRNWSSIFYGTIGACLSFGKRRLVADVRGMHSPDQYRGMKAMSGFINKYIAVSKDIAGALEEEGGIARQKIVTMHNGVDISRFENNVFKRDLTRKELGIGQDDMVVGTVGRLAKVKNYEILLRAFHAVSEKMERAKLIFVGDGPEKETLRKLSADLSIAGKVVFRGFDTSVEKFYRIMDIFVLPSIREGSSNTILEAMASHVPVLASDAGGNKELVRDKESGGIFPSNDYRSLAVLIEEYLGDPELCKKMAENAFLRLKDEYDINKTVAKYEGIYSEIVKQ